eukprot:CAMPEP_0181475850 /NCGR_PEP_ID=MMETSP1110-20121109/41403_1 /TAXON_ID=174948 /ORGANISM="Symbiodinium sp., Strain CCMP421" /LENGTH=82 /DNA_ID=CAMNT_0023601113 /DNA_START=220 /DNA_END=468 /DNA_ORIENTATION=-
MNDHSWYFDLLELLQRLQRRRLLLQCLEQLGHHHAKLLHHGQAQQLHHPRLHDEAANVGHLHRSKMNGTLRAQTATVQDNGH